MDNGLNTVRVSADDGVAEYVGVIVGRSAATGDPAALRYNVNLTNLFNPDDKFSLVNYKQPVPMFKNVIVEACPLGTPVSARRAGGKINVSIPETCVYEERCT